MWLREMKRFIRFRSRILMTLIQPLFFLIILGSGLKSVSIMGMKSDFFNFFAPGIIAMSIMFSSMFTGVSVLWDRQFGFLQEVLVAPVSRVSIIIGRTLGGATTALIQGFIILIIIIALGIPVASILGLILTIIFMILISFSSVGFGLILASKMRDMQTFPLIINLVLMPLMLVSSAFFPLNNLPPALLRAAQFNPVFYMVDGLRGSLLGVDFIIHPLIDLVILLAICITMLLLGTYFFSKSEA
jgi:ABC-2 type transport system permease protein